MHATRSAVTSVQLAELVARDGNAGDADAAGRLYDWLIRPSEADIAAARQLIVVPDPALESVSFAGLWDAREKRHLIERLAVAVAPSAGSLRPETGQRDLQSVTAIALPTGEQGENVALPQASVELREIAGMYRHAVVLAGSNATLEALQTNAREAAVVHIAGHTERRGRAGESVLAFPGPHGKGLEYVSWRNLVAMPLRSRPVVVLAACETLQRPRSPQTFALSLGGGFLAAGAPAVIGTLVPLADNDAQALFEDVHRQLRAGFSPAEALRRTQLRALADKHGRSLPWQALALLTNQIPR
jgi:CHAT domain-containing protein